ncbi:MAG: putative ATP-dependent RNA helicase dhr2 [Claussenomyces sp. TS43310]|nr:MAG: putative ATP-dependent RNA helicase dhr2 [Claussenomyces sp. TS43310]
MPKHTKFTDGSTGLGSVVEEFQKCSPRHKGPSFPESQSPPTLRGVKRSRDGSPKSISEEGHTKSREDKTEGNSGHDLSARPSNYNKNGNSCKDTDTDGRGAKDSKGPAVSLLNFGGHPSQKTERTRADQSFGVMAKSPKAASSVLQNQNGQIRRLDNGMRAHTTQSQPSDSFVNGSVGGKIGKSRPSAHQIEAQARRLLTTRKTLPIWTHKADIRWSLRHSDILLLVGETGSGKSTQVPQFLISEPWSKSRRITLKREDGREYDTSVGGTIAITEPRRVAAMSLAERVAKEHGSHLGRGQMNDKDAVGYSVRFDHVVPKNVKIKFLTEGMLLQELQQDPGLRQYSAVVIDEIHERSVDVDLLAGFLRNLVRGDKKDRGGVPLKLVIMSATANTEGLRQFFSVRHDEYSVDESDLAPKVHSQSVEGPGSSTNFLNAEETSKSDPGRKTSSKSADRRTSDVSYSSWEGIISDEEKPTQDERVDTHAASGKINDSSLTNPQRDVDWPDVAVHYIRGRQYPVKIFYTPAPVADYMEAMLQTIFTIHTSEPLPGDILAFLTGQDEIESLQKMVEQTAEKLNNSVPKIKVLTLYGQLPIEQQQEAFAAIRDKRTRKVVIATNIAETSVTVPGVRFVVDCGKAKIKHYRARLGLESLLAKPISKSSAIQRKGRAGREAAGKCYRLYTEAQYLKLPEVDLPEILRSNVSEAVLKMKANGVDDIFSFPLMDPPDLESMERALFTLHQLGAVDDNCRLSSIGETMTRFPISVYHARVLIAAAEPDAGCLLEAVDVISVLGDEIFVQPKSEEEREMAEDSRSDLIRREGDILTYLTAIQRYCSENINRLDWCMKRFISNRNMQQALKVRKQLRQHCLTAKLLAELPPPDPQPFVPMSPERAEILLKCFLKAFIGKTASLQPDGSYLTLQNRDVVAIHPSSVLHGQKMEAIMFLEHVFTQKNYAKKISRIQLNWVAEASGVSSNG